MGTRNLTAVQVEGKYVVAQYGQWDGYPSGQGVTALEFCQKHLNTKKGREGFLAKLKNVKFSEDEAELNASTFERERDDFSQIADVNNHISGLPAKKKEQYPYAGRDNAANILNLIMEAPADKTVCLTDGIAFVGDSLFCEYAYVIDLDAGTFEVFKGFNKRKLGQTQRFKDFYKEKEHLTGAQYHPVSLLKKYDLDNLPSKAVFLEELCPKEKEG